MKGATTFICNILLAGFVITIVETFVGHSPEIAVNPTVLVLHIFCTIQANIRMAKGALRRHFHLVKAPFVSVLMLMTHPGTFMIVQKCLYST